MDMKVIDGHVVPNHVLFTTPTPKGTEYPTLANGDMLKVTVSLSVQGEGPNAKRKSVVPRAPAAVRSKPQRRSLTFSSYSVIPV